MTSRLPRSRSLKTTRRSDRSGWWFVAPYFGLFLVFGVFGLLYSFYASLNLWVIGGETEGMQFRGLNRYVLVFIDPDFWAAMKRSLVSGLPVVIGQHFIALPLAFALHLIFARALGTLGALFFLPYLASSISLTAAMSVLLNLLSSPLNDLLGLLHQLPLSDWLPSRIGYESSLELFSRLWSAVGWNVLLYLMAMGAIPRSLFEAAGLDGAGFWRQLGQVVFPLVRPMVFVAFGMSLVTSLQTNAWTANYNDFDTVNLPGYIYGTAFRYFNLGLANTQTWVFYLMMLGMIGLAYFWIGRNFSQLQTSAGLEADHAPLRLPAVTTVLIKLVVFGGILISLLPILSVFGEATRGSAGTNPWLSTENPQTGAGALFWHYVPEWWRNFISGSAGPPNFAFGAGAAANYAQLMEYLPAFWRNLWNSLYVSGLATVGTVATSALAGFAFALLSFPYKRPLFLLVMAALVFPAMSNAIPYLIEMRLLNWIDTPRALWVPATMSALGVFLVRQYTQTAIPKSLVESARVDGANDWTIFSRIALSQMAPVLTTVALLTFVTTWNHLDSAIFVMRSEATRLLPQALGLLGDVGNASVIGAALGLVPVLLVYWLTASQLGRGLGLSAAPGRGLRQTLTGWRLGLLERWQQNFAATQPGLGVLDGADGIRAMACLMVVFHHLSQRLEMPAQQPWIQELQALVMTGAFGVSAFFVLSGMLLSLPFWQRFLQGKPAPSLGTFALRRFWRIAPGFYVALIVTFLIARAFEPGDSMWLRLLSGLTFTSGFHYVSFFPVELNGPLWSIGFEVFCYALMPLFMLGLFALARHFPRPPSRVSERTTTRSETRNSPSGITEITTRTTVRTREWNHTHSAQPQPGSAWLAFAYWIGVLIFTMAAHQWILTHLVPGSEGRGWQYGLIGGAKFWMPNYNLVGFFAQYCIGVLCAGWIAYRQYRLKQNPHLLARGLYFDLAAAVGLLGLLILLWNMRRAPEFALSIGQQPYAFPVFALLIALVLGAAPFATQVHRLIDNPFARYTARISFGLYIWHYPILELVRLFHNPDYRYFGISDLGQWFGLAGLVLILAYSTAALSYTHIEKPFLATGARKARTAPDAPG